MIQSRLPRTGLLIVLSAPSGAGKTTVVTRLLRSDRKIKRSISATTRASRAGERRGRDYLFLRADRFRRLIRKRAFLEWACVFGRYYGTPKAPVLRWRKQGFDVILVIDVQGARKVMAGGKVLSIFMKPPSVAELRRRLLRRKSDSAAEQRKRLRSAQAELAQAGRYDHVVVNRSVAHTVQALKRIIRTARKRAAQI